MNRYRLHAIKTISGKARQTKFWGIGVFIVMSIGFAVSSLVLINTIKFTQVNIVSVEQQPLLVPIMVNGMLVSLYLAFTSAISVSREYDKGTLELLMYGPVDESSFILGNFLAQLFVFLVSVLAALVWTAICIWQINLTFHWDILWIFLSTFFMAAQLVALGLLTAILGGKTRNSLVYLVLFVLLFAAIPLADTIVSNLVVASGSTGNDPLLIVRDVLLVVNNIISWISPYALMRDSVNGLMDGSTTTYLVNMAVMFFETLLMIFGSIFALRKKGVRG